MPKVLYNAQSSIQCPENSIQCPENSIQCPDFYIMPGDLYNFRKSLNQHFSAVYTVSFKGSKLTAPRVTNEIVVGGRILPSILMLGVIMPTM